jgi:hypothetical protein
LILFDVWHHLQYPGTALAEFSRVVEPGGRVVIFEPGMSLLGLIVYGYFHHEPLGYDQPVPWIAPSHFCAADSTYYASAANASRFFFSKAAPEKLADWNVLEKTRLAALSYVASGGFRGPQLYPSWLYRPMRAVDAVAGLLPWLFATRLLVVLERRMASTVAKGRYAAGHGADCCSQR